MTTTVRALVTEVVADLMDTTTVRWTMAELMRYYDEALLLVAIARRDAVTKTIEHTLAIGYEQALPADGMGLVDLPANSDASKKAIRWVDRGLLDRFSPGWREAAGSLIVKNFMYDPADPLRFYVNPPALEGAKVRLVYAATPAPHTGTPAQLSEITGDIPLPDQFRPALRLLMMQRAYSRDSEDASNRELAMKAAGEAATLLGVDASTLMGAAPSQSADTAKRKGKPT